MLLYLTGTLKVNWEGAWHTQQALQMGEPCCGHYSYSCYFHIKGDTEAGLVQLQAWTLNCRVSARICITERPAHWTLSSYHFFWLFHSLTCFWSPGVEAIPETGGKGWKGACFMHSVTHRKVFCCLLWASRCTGCWIQQCLPWKQAPVPKAFLRGSPEAGE